MNKDEIIKMKDYQICDSIGDDENLCLPDPTTMEEEYVVLVDNDKMTVKQIISKGAISPSDYWFDQNEGEFIYMLKGIGVISFEDGSCERLNKGSTMFIAPHIKHRVSYTSLDAVWLCVFSK